MGVAPMRNTSKLPEAKSKEQEPKLTVPQVARIMNVTQFCVREWISSGALRAVRVGQAGHWRVDPKDLEAALVASK